MLACMVKTPDPRLNPPGHSEPVHFRSLYQGIAFCQMLASCLLVVIIATVLFCQAMRPTEDILAAAFESSQTDLPGK